MRALFHPEFPRDIRRFEAEYARISTGLSKRFRHEVEKAVDVIKQSPAGAGHFLNVGSSIVPQLRRRNLWAFPFFVLYGVTEDQIVFGSVIPSRSDPLTWLSRIPGMESG